MQLMYMSAHHADAWLVEALREMGHVVEIGDWGVETAELAADGGYDLLLADVVRPDAEVVTALADGPPVVLVADAADAGEQAAALRAGADSCLVRPLHLIEVQARLMALARLPDRMRAARTDAGGLVLDRGGRRLLRDGREASLSASEFRLVAYLLRRRDQVVDLVALDRYLSGETSEPQPERIRSLVSRLRAKLAAALGEPLIHSVRGHGYVLRTAPQAPAP